MGYVRRVMNELKKSVKIAMKGPGIEGKIANE